MWGEGAKITITGWRDKITNHYKLGKLVGGETMYPGQEARKVALGSEGRIPGGRRQDTVGGRKIFFHCRGVGSWG